MLPASVVEWAPQAHNGPIEAEGESVKDVTEGSREPTAVLDSPQITRILVYGLPNRELIPTAFCLIKSGRQVKAQLAPTSDGIFGCTPSILRRSRIEIGAEGYVSIANELEDDVPMLLEYELQPAGQLEITVLGDTVLPVEKARITVYPRDLSEPNTLRPFVPLLWKDDIRASAAPLTDASGRLQLTGYPCDTELIVTASGVVPEVSASVTIPSETRQAGLTLHAPGRGCLRGQVMWSDRTPVTEPLIIRSLEHGTMPVAPPEVQTMPDGTFELCGLPRGRVNWYVVRDGESSRFANIDSPIVDIGIIYLEKHEILSGRVVSEDVPEDFSYGSVGLRFYQRGGLVGQLKSVAAGGSFKVGIPAGEVTVEVHASSWILCRTIATVPGPELLINLDDYVARLTITGAPFEKDDIFLVKLRRVQPEDGPSHSLPPQLASFLNMPASSAMVWPGDQRFSLLFQQPGTYDVFVSRRGEAGPFIGRAVLTAGSEAELAYPPAESARIEGLLLDVEGLPIERARIGASLTKDSVFLESSHAAVTKADGTFSFPNLFGGPWLVFPLSLGANAPSTAVVYLEPGQTRSVTLRVDRPVRLSGRITRNGRPVPEIGLFLKPVISQEVNMSPAQRTQCTSDKDGTYEFVNVFPGSYLLVAATPDLSTWQTRSIVIGPSAESIINWDLESGLSPVLFTRGGEVFSAVDGGFLYTSTTKSKLAAWPGRPGVWEATVDGGSALALLISRETPQFVNPSSKDLFYLAYSPSCVPSDDPTPIPIQGERVVVQLVDNTALLPLAYFEELAEFGNVWGLKSRPCLVYEDDGTRRSFDSIPIGTTVTLASSPVGGRGVVMKRITVTGPGPIALNWPPEGR